jgi:hypothetical protein
MTTLLYRVQNYAFLSAIKPSLCKGESRDIFVYTNILIFFNIKELSVVTWSKEESSMFSPKYKYLALLRGENHCEKDTLFLYIMLEHF